MSETNLINTDTEFIETITMAAFIDAGICSPSNFKPCFFCCNYTFF